MNRRNFASNIKVSIILKFYKAPDSESIMRKYMYFQRRFREIRISHDDVTKWKHFPRYWPFVRGIHRSPVNSPHKGQWRGALMFSFICTRTNGWVNNPDTGDLRRHRTHYDVNVMVLVLQPALTTRVSSPVPQTPTQWAVTPVAATAAGHCRPTANPV